MWYDIKQTLTYNALFNFVYGNRGSGKTYSAKKWCIDDFVKNGKEFVYLRRYDTEFKNNKNFFNSVAGEYKDLSFSVKGRKYFINDNLCGYAIALSKSTNLKSNEYPNVNKIIFDEFVIDKGVYHYLTNEVEVFLNLYETIARFRNDVRAVFLGNAISEFNPYSLYFNLKMPFNNTVRCKNDILVQLVQNEEFINAKKNTRFGKIISGTPFEKFSVNNEFIRDSNKDFISKKSGSSTYFCTFLFRGNKIGVWVDYKMGCYFMSNDVEESNPVVYALTLDDHTENTIYQKGASKSIVLKTFAEAYKMGIVYFENRKIKSLSYDIIKMLLL